MVIDELITLLGFDLKADTMQKVKKFEQSIVEINKAALAVAASITVAAASFGYFAEKAVSSASELDKFNELTGTSAEEIQKWRYAAEQAGGSAKGIQSDIEGLMSALNPVMPGEFNQGLFLLNMYGKQYANVSDMMLELSRRFKGMNPIEQVNWAKQAGIGQDTLLLLRKDESEIRRLMAETPFMMGKEQTAAAREFEKQINRVKYTLTALSELAITKLAPTFSRIVDKLEGWARSSKVNGFLDKMVQILSDPKLIGGTIEAAIWGIVAASIALNIKWIAIAAAITAAVLAWRDFQESQNDPAANTVTNRLSDKIEGTFGGVGRWISDKLGWKTDPAAVARDQYYAAHRGEGKKSSLTSTMDMLSMMMNQATAPSGSYSAPTQQTVTVNNNIQIDGSDSPYETGQELNYRLGTIKWGNVVPTHQ